jgi:hypothetical protein
MPSGVGCTAHGREGLLPRYTVGGNTAVLGGDTPKSGAVPKLIRNDYRQGDPLAQISYNKIIIFNLISVFVPKRSVNICDVWHS